MDTIKLVVADPAFDGITEINLGKDEAREVWMQLTEQLFEPTKVQALVWLAAQP